MLTKKCLTALFLFVMSPAFAHAQGVVQQAVPFASTPNPVGSGARALGWANAFIAVADDATAASWNPAGLIQLTRPETSAALSYHTRSEDLDFGGLSSDSESRAVSAVNLNYVSVAVPFNLFDVNFVAAVNYQRLYEFDRDLSYSASGVHSGSTTFRENRALEQFGAMNSITPALAVQITPGLAVGLAVNFWGIDEANQGWDQRWTRETFIRDGSAAVVQRSWSETREEYEMEGANYVIGLHCKLESWTFAAVYKSAWEAEVDYRRTYEAAAVFPFDAMSNYHVAIKMKESQTIVWPESYGLGVAWRYSDNFSLSLDAQTTRWSQYKLKTDAGDVNLLAVNDPDAEVSDSAWQAHFGLEYLWIEPRYVAALRGGVFYDPQPIEDTVNDFYGVALGGGVAFDPMVIDAAVQYRWGDDAEGETIEGVTSTADHQDFYGLVSVIYHF